MRKTMNKRILALVLSIMMVLGLLPMSAFTALAARYSRRINIQHRLVYQVYAEPIEVDGVQYQGTIKIVRMWTHYDNSVHLT